VPRLAPAAVAIAASLVPLAACASSGDRLSAPTLASVSERSTSLLTQSRATAGFADPRGYSGLPAPADHTKWPIALTTAANAAIGEQADFVSAVDVGVRAALAFQDTAFGTRLSYDDVRRYSATRTSYRLTADDASALKTERSVALRALFAPSAGVDRALADLDRTDDAVVKGSPSQLRLGAGLDRVLIARAWKRRDGNIEFGFYASFWSVTSTIDSAGLLSAPQLVADEGSSWYHDMVVGSSEGAMKVLAWDLDEGPADVFTTGRIEPGRLSTPEIDLSRASYPELAAVPVTRPALTRDEAIAAKIAPDAPVTVDIGPATLPDQPGGAGPHPSVFPSSTG